MVYCNDYDYYDGNYHCSSSAWYTWGRWVLAACVILFFIALFLMLACVRNRRRRNQGALPMYGTGWVGNNNGYGPTPSPYNYNNGAAPPYQQAPVGFQQTGNTYNGNEGYYAPPGQNIELQQPQNTYARGGDNVYDAPQGPPPNKGDGVVR